MLIDAQLNCQKTQNRINVLLGGTDSYQSCVVDINVEKGNGGGETMTSHDELVASVKSSESVVSKVVSIFVNNCMYQTVSLHLLYLLTAYAKDITETSELDHW